MIVILSVIIAGIGLQIDHTYATNEHDANHQGDIKLAADSLNPCANVICPRLNCPHKLPPIPVLGICCSRCVSKYMDIYHTTIHYTLCIYNSEFEM